MSTGKIMRTEKRGDKNKRLVTIDDAIELADRLHKQLQQLGSYKYPLDIRRGRRGIKTMCEQNNYGQRPKNGSKIYIFNQNDQKPEALWKTGGRNITTIAPTVRWGIYRHQLLLPNNPSPPCQIGKNPLESNCGWYRKRGATKMGEKLSIMSIVCIVSTHFAP